LYYAFFVHGRIVIEFMEVVAARKSVRGYAGARENNALSRDFKDTSGKFCRKRMGQKQEQQIKQLKAFYR